MWMKTKYPGFRYELVDDVFYILRIYERNLCVEEYFLDACMRILNPLQPLLGKEMFEDLKRRWAHALADLLIDKLAENKFAGEEDELNLESFLNPDMELLVK